MATPAELAAARAAANVHRSRPVATWSAGLPASASETLQGIGCPVGPTAGYFADLEDAGALDPDAVLAIATDAAAPAYVRRRAALHAVHLANEAIADRGAVRDALEALAMDSGTPALVRSGALRGLVDVDGARAKVVAAALSKDGAAMVRRAAKAVGP
jgi:hypothetical protein